MLVPTTVSRMDRLMVLLVVLGLFVHPAGAHKHDGKAHGNIHKRAAAKCAAGKYSSTGSEPCAPCPAGSYSKETGRTSCILARAGYYIPTAGATSEKDCGASKYAPTAGMTACLPCPPGYMCPSNNVHTPQQCSPGRYSTGGVAYCPLCAAGTFNTIHSATGCCPCPAGCFTGQTGATNCQKCQWDRPYCNPGSTSSGQCVKKQGDYFLTGDCTLGGSGSACPPARLASKVSAIPRRHVVPRADCRLGQKACPVYRGTKISDYQCTEVQSNLVSCGGCLSYSVGGYPNAEGGRDCSAIPFVDEVRCIGGRCNIGSCWKGYMVSQDGNACVSILS